MINSNKAYSLVEMTIVTALVGLMAAAASYQMFNVKKEFNSVAKKLETNIEKVSSNIAIFEQLKKSSVSLNNLNLADDQNRNFFDYYSDVSEQILPELWRKRKLTITQQNKKTFFLLITASNEKSFYNPVEAYFVSSPPFDQSKAGQLIYKGANYNKVMQKKFKTTWKQGSLFLFNSPTPLRTPINGKINLKQAPREMSFLGEVNRGGSDLTKVSLSVFRSTHPANASIQLNSLDQFFKRLPSIGGAAPIVTAEAVQLLQLYVYPSGKKIRGKNVFGLYFSVFNSGKWQTPQLISEFVKKVEFYRSSVSMPLIGVKVFYDDELKRNAGYL